MAESTSTKKAELLARFGLTELTLRRKCSEKHLLEIASFISWKKVGPFLPNIASEDLEAIDEDGYDTADKRLKLLTVWEWRNGHEATYDALVTAMLRAGEQLEAAKVLELFQQEFSLAVLHSRPSLGQLRSMWLPSKRFTIIRTMVPWWRMVGRHLEISGAFLDEIQLSKRGDEFCCERVFQRWLEGMGVQPATWSALLGALDDARFFDLVEDARLCLTAKFEYPVIEGAEIAAQEMIEVMPNTPLDFHWEGHGFRVHIPAGAISGGPVRLCIQASLSGDYQLPDDDGGGVLVSGVYWLSLHPPVKRFDKKVTITLQHCASNDDSALSFITAKCTQETLPYTFKPLPGGAFSGGEGTIQVNYFAAFALFGRPVKYAIRTYFVPKQLNTYDTHITVTQKKDLVMKRVREMYEAKSAEEGPTVPMVRLESGQETISLDISRESWVKDGWRLCPLSSPLLIKEDLDDYAGGGAVPAFQIELKMEEPRSLEQRVGIVGVVPEGTFITITRHPEEQGRSPLIVSDGRQIHPGLEQKPLLGPQPAPRPTLPELLRLKIAQGVGTHYSDFGTFLLNDATGVQMDSIERECAKEPERIVKTVLSRWLQGKGLPVKWETLVQTLRDVDLNVLAEEVATKHLPSN